MKIYTKTGDSGNTALLSGNRVNKNHPRLEAYGSVDELNSYLGLILSTKIDNELLQVQFKILTLCQHYLFNIGSLLACDDEKLLKNLPKLNDTIIKSLEDNIDLMTSSCPELKNFILPGGQQISAHLHVARCICRRAERHSCHLENSDETVIIFLNRLSDYLFSLARYVNKLHSQNDIVWSKSPE